MPIDDFYYRQRGESATNIEEWRFPRWIQPGMLIELTQNRYQGSYQQIDMNGNSIGSKQAINMGTPTLVLVVRVSDGYLEGLVGEDLYRLSGKFAVSNTKERSMM